MNNVSVRKNPIKLSVVAAAAIYNSSNNNENQSIKYPRTKTTISNRSSNK